jgi:hypothetical protein
MIQLKYPVFEFIPKDNLVYVGYNDNRFKTTNTEIFKKTKFGNHIIIDSSEMKYVTKSAYITRYWGFWEGLLRMLGKVVSIEFEYKDAGTPVTLEELKEMIMERYPKSRWFHSAWSDVEEF